MKRAAMMLVLCLSPGMTQATFDLEDPAAQMYQEQQAMRHSLANQSLQENTLCVIDAETNECFCILAESEQEVSMADNECEALASKAAILKRH